MLTLPSYPGVVQNGAIRLRDMRLPEGAQAVLDGRLDDFLDAYLRYRLGR